MECVLPVGKTMNAAATVHGAVRTNRFVPRTRLDQLLIGKYSIPGLRDKLVQLRRLPSSETGHGQYDAAGALACARRRGDVTHCNGTDTPAYGRPWRHLYNRKYITYRNVSTSHGARYRPTCTQTGEGRMCSFGDMLANKNTHTNAQTDTLVTILRHQQQVDSVS